MHLWLRVLQHQMYIWQRGDNRQRQLGRHGKCALCWRRWSRCFASVQWAAEWLMRWICWKVGWAGAVLWNRVVDENLMGCFGISGCWSRLIRWNEVLLQAFHLIENYDFFWSKGRFSIPQNKMFYSNKSLHCNALLIKYSRPGKSDLV